MNTRLVPSDGIALGWRMVWNDRPPRFYLFGIKSRSFFDALLVGHARCDSTTHSKQKFVRPLTKAGSKRIG
jgi:hypothetical protein